MKKIVILMLISLSLEAALQQRQGNQGSLIIVCRGVTLYLNRPEFDEPLAYLCKKSNQMSNADKNKKLDNNGKLNPGTHTFDFSLFTQKELAQHLEEIERIDNLYEFTNLPS